MSSSDATIVREEEWILGEEVCNLSCLPMAMKAALDLDVLQIISYAGHGFEISPAQIVAQIPNVTNPDAAITLDRILRVLASHSILSCSVTTGENGKPERLYGLTPFCKYLLPNKDGLSLAPLARLKEDKSGIDTMFYLKDAVLEGSQPFVKAHGVNTYEKAAKDQRVNSLLNIAMAERSALVMERILDSYQGFNDLEELLDVGGGLGSTINLIVSKHPHIKGVNFDLPHVVKVAPDYPGVTHVSGDMFENVPFSRTILMKWVLHNWSDDHCISILKNCHKALPEKGKVIVVDYILSSVVDTSPSTRQAIHEDLCMLAYTPGGRERTIEDFSDLAKASGFSGGIKTICFVNGFGVIEFYK